MTLFEGGAGIPLHTHNCPESVVILEGQVIVEIDSVEHALGRWDTTYVAAGIPHRFRNASDTEPMRILWTYASVDATRTIVETGVTTRVDAEHDQPRPLRGGWHDLGDSADPSSRRGCRPGGRAKASGG
jgi:uncharacterized cupin superfamily protein